MKNKEQRWKNTVRRRDRRRRKKYCEDCKRSKNVRLTLHHVDYERGRRIVRTLCRKCHGRYHVTPKTAAPGIPPPIFGMPCMRDDGFAYYSIEKMGIIWKHGNTIAARRLNVGHTLYRE